MLKAFAGRQTGRKQLQLAALLLVAVCARAEHVIAPRASLLDVQARRAALKTNRDKRVAVALQQLDSCIALPFVPAPTGRMLIPHHYLSGSHGPVNPEEAKVTRTYSEFERRTSAGMNQFVVTGSHAEANCAQKQIDAWAQAAALLDYDPKESSQAWFQVEWTLSSEAIAESVLVNDAALAQPVVARDIAWLNRVAHRTVDFDKAGTQRNNHHYWRGLAATAVGVVSADDNLFTWGLATFREAVNDIDANGAFPQEMARHERAIHYQEFALQPLIPIAEFAARQQVNLYAYTSRTGKTITDAVTFLHRAVANPGIVKPYASEEQLVDDNTRDFYSYADYFHANNRSDMAECATLGLESKPPSYASRVGGNTTVLAASTETLHFVACPLTPPEPAAAQKKAQANIP